MNGQMQAHVLHVQVFTYVNTRAHDYIHLLLRACCFDGFVKDMIAIPLHHVCGIGNFVSLPEAKWVGGK